MREACDMQGGKEKYTQGFGGRCDGKRPTWKTYAQMRRYH